MQHWTRTPLVSDGLARAPMAAHPPLPREFQPAVDPSDWSAHPDQRTSRPWGTSPVEADSDWKQPVSLTHPQANRSEPRSTHSEPPTSSAREGRVSS